MLACVALAAAAIAVPPVTLTVRAAATIPPQVVNAALDEAASVWREAGIALLTQHDDDESSPSDRAATDHRSLPRGLSIAVVFDDGPPTMKDFVGTIGWIQFDASNTPMPEIHLVHANVIEMMRGMYGEATMNQMTQAQRQTYLSRALGRALAHEVGHFLFQSKVHSSGGLMKARQAAGALFGPDRKAFVVSVEQRRAAAARLLDGLRLASR